MKKIVTAAMFACLVSGAGIASAQSTASPMSSTSPMSNSMATGRDAAKMQDCAENKATKAGEKKVDAGVSGSTTSDTTPCKPASHMMKKSKKSDMSASSPT